MKIYIDGMELVVVFFVMVVALASILVAWNLALGSAHKGQYCRVLESGFVDFNRCITEPISVSTEPAQ